MFLPAVFAVILFTCVASESPASTFVVSNTNDVGAGSLRQAILDANATNGLDRIVFDIPGSGVRTISPASALPSLTESTEIDGTTQPGYSGSPLIELNGTAAGDNPGLRLVSGNNTVRGLAINRFGSDGLRLDGQGTNWIAGNYIGTDPSGTIARGNGREGLWIDGSPGNIIGGTNASDRNVVSGNSDAGIYILSAVANVIQGNFIGTTAAGTAALGNANSGLVLYNAAENHVGGAVPGSGNIISGNRGSGVYVNGSLSAGNRVQGNYIGLGPDGRTALSNAADGITISGAAANLVGGDTPGEGNVISGNGKAGLFLTGALTKNNVVQANFVGTDSAGVSAVGNNYAGVTLSGARSNLIGGASASARNLLSGNLQDGIFLSTNSIGNCVQGNFIGVDAGGTDVLPNGYNGLSLKGAGSNYIGGAGAAARNVISGNSYYGLQLSSGAEGNCIEGNFIGVDATGQNRLGNRLSGVRLESGGNRLGAPGPAGNIISGNGQDGIFAVGSGATSNVIQGNFVGTDLTGTRAVANGRSGLGFSDAPGNVVGGTDPGAGNIISGNTEAGVYLFGSGASANRIVGNVIGADASGTAPLGNGFEGVYLENCHSNVIGHGSVGAGNLISGNHTRGILLTNASWNSFQGNLIGTARDGVTALNNVFHNIEFQTGATNNLVGGAAGEGNVIAFAGTIYCGIRVRAGSINNRFSGNSIFANGGLGIDLGTAGATSNDLCDIDNGANEQQNFPVLTQAVSGTGCGMRGTLNSTANTGFLLQFFALPPTGQRKQLFLGELMVVTDGTCSADFVASLTTPAPPGYLVTATATDPANNTSEFSSALAVSPLPHLDVVPIGAGQLSLSWSGAVPNLVLKETLSLSPPVRWQTVTNAPVLTGGRYITTLAPPESDRFYALSFE